MSAIIRVSITKTPEIHFEIGKRTPNESKIKWTSSTVGSNRWLEGEFDEYKEKIFIKTREILTQIHEHAQEFLIN